MTRFTVPRLLVFLAALAVLTLFFNGAPASAQNGSAPATPTGLTTAVDDSTVTLTWNDPGDDSITHYQIFRRDRDSQATGVFDLIEDNTGSSATSYTDTSVQPDKRYVYRVKAVNQHGASTWSRFARADTPTAPEPTPEPTAVPTVEPTAAPTEVPTPESTPEPTVEPTVAPTLEPTAVPTSEPTPQADKRIGNLVVTSNAPGELTLTWSVPNPVPNDYRVVWAESGSDYSSWRDPDGNLYPTGASATLTNLTPGAEYKVKVRARYGSDAPGPWSDEVRQAAMPAPPLPQATATTTATSVTSPEPTVTATATATAQLTAQPTAMATAPPQPVASPEPIATATATAQPTATAEAQPASAPSSRSISDLAIDDQGGGTLTISWTAASEAPCLYRVNWALIGEEYPDWLVEPGNFYTASSPAALTFTPGEYKIRVSGLYCRDVERTGPWSETTHTVAASQFEVDLGEYISPRAMVRYIQGDAPQSSMQQGQESGEYPTEPGVEYMWQLVGSLEFSPGWFDQTTGTFPHATYSSFYAKHLMIREYHEWHHSGNTGLHFSYNGVHQPTDGLTLHGRSDRKITFTLWWDRQNNHTVIDPALIEFEFGVTQIKINSFTAVTPGAGSWVKITDLEGLRFRVEDGGSLLSYYGGDPTFDASSQEWRRTFD